MFVKTSQYKKSQFKKVIPPTPSQVITAAKHDNVHKLL